MFYRANVNSKGSGLGLFILKKTVGRLRGKVSVKSVPTVGTTVLITMPNYVPVANQGDDTVRPLADLINK
jgi:signal transduction histidine kinase